MKIKAIKQLVMGILILVVMNNVMADVFRTENSDGTVSYSDRISPNATKIEPNKVRQRYKNTVVKVIDGDTIELENGERVRLLGIDTPEVASYYRKAVAGGNAAKKWLTKQLQDEDVYLEYDHQQRDKYKRLLANIFLENGEHINTTLVRNGLAIVNLFPPNLNYKDDLLAAQEIAQQQQLGMWAMRRYQLTPVNKVRKVAGWKRYQGEVQLIKNNPRYVRLILGDKLSVRIAKENLYLFPSLEDYMGKKVEVRGWLSGKKAPFSILVRHPSALIII